MEHPIPLQRQIYQCVNNSSHAYSQSPLHAPYCALKGKPHQSLAPPSALIPTTKLAPTGQKHFIYFGSCRWGESHSPCFIFSRNFPDVASRTFITISPRLRPGLPSLRSVLPSRQGEMLGSCLLET